MPLNYYRYWCSGSVRIYYTGIYTANSWNSHNNIIGEILVGHKFGEMPEIALKKYWQN